MLPNNQCPLFDGASSVRLRIPFLFSIPQHLITPVTLLSSSIPLCHGSLPPFLHLSSSFPASQQQSSALSWLLPKLEVKTSELLSRLHQSLGASAPMGLQRPIFPHHLARQELRCSSALHTAITNHSPHHSHCFSFLQKQSSGSGFKSIRAFRSGYFAASIQLQRGYTAGVITAFYVSEKQKPF